MLPAAPTFYVVSKEAHLSGERVIEGGEDFLFELLL
jgi:hypothetical protein